LKKEATINFYLQHPGMPALFLYILKLSISLSIVYLFYHLLLRRLTFYNSNRWYLIGYSLLSFLIPFINISPVLENNKFSQSGIVQLIPAVEKFTSSSQDETAYSFVTTFSGWNKWDWISFTLLAVAVVLLLRFIIRCISFLNMRRKAGILTVDGMKLYQVHKNIIPFSFGNSIFINRELHTEDELQEIIRHEFVHVKQKHTLDIIWSEWLCIINWYNPFAWLLKTAIRQNLEFIADNKVLQNGVDRKHYQYLLLKVIGNSHFSLASKFNFSSLKKRITMMNKLQSAKLHLVKFLFIVPLLAVILISFRQRKQEPVLAAKRGSNIFQVTDTVPGVNEPNEKGYIIHVKQINGKSTVVIKDKYGKEVKRFSRDEWNKDESNYEKLYGELPPPPPVPPVPPLPPAPPKPVRLPAHVKSINVNNEKASVLLKNGTKENYDLSIPAEKAAFEKKYGELPEPPEPPEAPEPPTPRSASSPSVTSVETIDTDNISTVADEYDITDKKAVIHLKSGVIEEYDLTNTDNRRKFEKKYGKIIKTDVNASVNATSNISINTSVNSNSNVHATIATSVAPVAIANHESGRTVIAPMSPVVAAEVNVLPVDPLGYTITGEEDILVTITRKTTSDQLEAFKKQMKEKGIELKFDDIEYDNGKLVNISGSMKSKDGHSNFSASDFSKLILAMIRDGNRTYFKVSITDNKKVVI
jgi:bla regulator protein blaR1